MPSPYAVHRPVENTYLVRQHDRKRLRELFGVAAAVLVLGGGLFAFTWVHVEMLRTGYRVDTLERRLSHLLEVERQWRVQGALEAHPELIARRAKKELGMVDPSLDQMIFYEEIRPPDSVPPDSVPPDPVGAPLRGRPGSQERSP